MCHQLAIGAGPHLYGDIHVQVYVALLMTIGHLFWLAASSTPSADQTYTSEQKQVCDLERGCDQLMVRLARTRVLVSSIPDAL